MDTRRNTFPTVDTPEHRQASNELLARLLPAMGMEVSLNQLARETGVPIGSMRRWTARAASLAAVHHPTLNAWIEKRAARTVA